MSRGGRPFVGRPGASRLFGGRCRAGSCRRLCGANAACCSFTNASAAPNRLFSTIVPGSHGLDLVEHPERQRRPVEPNREPAVGVVHHLDLLACQAARQRRRVQHQHHPVIVQGKVARDRPLLPPRQDLVEIIRGRQLPVQILGVRGRAAKAVVVSGR